MERRGFFTLFTAAALCALLAVPAHAANRVTEIAVDVTLEPDGSAYVVQTWNGSFDEGTECYFPIENLGEMTLSDLTVSDVSGDYETLDVWDVDASLEEKAGKCGLNPMEDGYEVCWGIGSYGQNRYAVEYRLGGLVGAYGDADGFLFQFIPDGMNTGPTDVTVRVHTRDGAALTAENAGIWAFGFEGQATFTLEGGVLAHTETPLTGDNSVILMLRLEKGLLTPARTIDGSFEVVKTRAFVGSDYLPGEDGEEQEADDENDGLSMALGLLGVAGVGVLFYRGGAEKRRLKKFCQTADYWREAPIGGNLEASFVLASRFHQSNDEGNLIAAALTRLLAEGCLEAMTVTDVGFMGREKKNVSLRLVKKPADGGLTARLLYDLLTQAAGSDDILQEHELERYCETNYTELLGILAEAKRDGGETLTAIRCCQSRSAKTLEELTDRGKMMLSRLIGYKKYLLDFSLIAERGVDEALIWQDLLTYAALYGVADKVMEQLHKLYPGDMNAYARQMENTYYIAYRYRHVTYGAAISAQSTAQRLSGGGGHSSLGGGGGFSGGGHGGGTR